MLVLTRKLGEKIFIGSDIVVTLVGIDSNRVRIGIEAPDQVRILRAELQDGFKDDLYVSENPRGKKTSGRQLAGSY